METTVVNKRRENYDIYIGRPSIWGNPFVIGKDGTRELMNRIHELKGKKLGCFCAPLACHGDVLAIIADFGGDS